MQGNQHEIDRYIIGFNQQVSDIFEKQQKHELTPGCKNALILFLCHTAFPFCSKTGMRQIPCSDYCELLDDTHTCPGLQELISQTNTYSLSPLVELKCEMQEEGPKDVCLPPPGRVTAPPGVAETGELVCARVCVCVSYVHICVCVQCAACGREGSPFVSKPCCSQPPWQCGTM